MDALRIVFAGSPAAAVPSLTTLASGPHEVVGVLTRQDSPQGRRGVLTPTAVATEAERLALPLVRANRLVGPATEAIEAMEPDLGVIVAYGGLVREPLLSTPRLGWINVHFSLLPRWRGAAPVQRAIMAGDETTGVTVFRLVEELDAGDVLGQLSEPIGKHQTAGNLLTVLSESGAALLARTVDALADGTAHARPQRGEVTLAPKLTISDGEIDWSQPGALVGSRICGVTPEPGAFTIVDGARLKVHEAALTRDLPPIEPGEFSLAGKRVMVGTGTDPIELITVQPAGRTAMDAAAWWRGRASS